jgi:hypothetical protein
VSRHVSLVLTSLAALSPSLFAQAPFEGVVTMQVTMPGTAPLENVMSVKGTRGRSDMTMNGMQAYTIMDFDKGSIVAVMPSQRMYMMVSEALTKSIADTAAVANVSFKPTGKKGTFAGVSCDYYLIQFQSDMDADACIAKGLGTFFGMGGPGARGNSASGTQKAMRQLAKQFKGGTFVLKMDMRQKGQPGMSMEVTKLEKKPIDDSVFALPEGFQDMTSMMKNMPGARPPGGR